MGLFDRHPAEADFFICPICESVLVSKSAPQHRIDRALDKHFPECVDAILDEVME
jgi:hypothetical protein